MQEDRSIIFFHFKEWLLSASQESVNGAVKYEKI